MKLSVELEDTHWMLPRSTAKVICQENLNNSVSLSLSKADTAGSTLEFHVNTLGHSIFASLNFLTSQRCYVYEWLKLIICCVRNKLHRTRMLTTLFLRNIVCVGTKYGCWLARIAFTLEWCHRRRGGLLCVYSWQVRNVCQLKEHWCGVWLCCACVSHNYYVVKIKIKVK